MNLGIILFIIWFVGGKIFLGICLAHDDIEDPEAALMSFFWPLTIIVLIGYGIGIILKKIGI